MGLLIDIPLYQCHLQIRALKIKMVVANPRGYELHFENDSFVPMQVSDEWAEANDPVPGGYAAWYGDGVISYIAAAEFEFGFTLIE